MKRDGPEMTGDGSVSQKLSAFVTQTRPLSSQIRPLSENVTQARPLSHSTSSGTP